MEYFDGSITSPRGILASGTACGIKKNNKPDLALVQVNGLGTAASVFTSNQVKGHSLLRSLELAKQEKPIRALVINSGNANACVGSQGDLDAELMAELTAKALGVDPDEVFTASTGVIGQLMPMTKVASGIARAASLLSHDTSAGHSACEAIMTTDKIQKEAAVSFQIGDKEVILAGMAKGSGMIHPNMATMIAVITTDALVDRDFLRYALRLVTNKTFNRVSVDGDTSVCDSCTIVATGLAENEAIGFGADGEPDANAKLFLRSLEAVCMRLARNIAADGEGATKLIDVRVEGAATAETAYKVALAVAGSPLVKTAMFGEDANWGRVITAVGNSGVPIAPEKIDISFGRLKVCENGAGLPFDEAEASAILERDEIIVTIDLKSGAYSDHYWTCDFSYEYVEINGSYRS